MKITLRDVKQQILNYGLIENDNFFLWGNIKSFKGDAFKFSFSNPMVAISYKKGYLYFIPFSFENVFFKATRRVKLENFMKITCHGELSTLFSSFTLSFYLNKKQIIKFSVPNEYKKQAKALHEISKASK